MRDPAVRLALALIVSIALLSTWQGCETYQPAPSTPAPTAAPGTGTTPISSRTPPTRPAYPPLTPVATVRSEPVVRVRIATNDTIVRLTGSTPLQAAPPNGQAITLAPPVTITRRGKGFLLAPAQGQTMQWDVAELHLRSTTGGPITVGTAAYPGSLSLHPARDDDGMILPGVGIDIVNHVGVETYLPGVLEHELYGSWDAEAYRAQAVAARSYAIDRIARHRQRNYDLDSDTRSQMYGGSATRPKAIDAVRTTYGQVLVWDGNVVPGYYSSDTGGLGQDASLAFTGERPIPPLAAHDHGAWSQQGGSTKFRWGPVVRDRADLSRRIAGWGAAQKQRHAVANLRLVTHIEVSQRNRLGRPAQFTLIDNTGQRFAMGPEQFRFACNFTPGGMTPLDKTRQLYSSCVEPSVSGDRVVFTNGRGFGHGVGMCQWGAQGMAKAGHRHPQILATYYPGATIFKAY